MTAQTMTRSPLFGAFTHVPRPAGACRACVGCTRGHATVSLRAQREMAGVLA